MPRHTEFPDVTTVRLPEGALRALAFEVSASRDESAADIMRDAIMKEIWRRQRARGEVLEPPRPPSRRIRGAS